MANLFILNLKKPSAVEMRTASFSREAIGHQINDAKAGKAWKLIPKQECEYVINKLTRAPVPSEDEGQKRKLLVVSRATVVFAVLIGY